MALSANQQGVAPQQVAMSPESAEQRAAARYTPLIRTAKITGISGEFLCVVSDISVTGVSVRLFHALPRDGELTLEMSNGDSLPIERVWEKEGRAGFRFTAAGDVNLRRILEGRSEWPKRPIRLNLDMPAALSGLTGRFEATIRNISLQGAQIECTARLAIDQRLRLSNDQLPEIVTKVRWRKGNTYGLVFDTTFQFAELARIVARAQGIGLENQPA
jgi:hypothetical protein